MYMHLACTYHYNSKLLFRLQSLYLIALELNAVTVLPDYEEANLARISNDEHWGKELPVGQCAFTQLLPKESIEL